MTDSASSNQYVDIVFDGPPSHESGRFVEVEDADGRSICYGEWIDRGNGLWALRVPRLAPETGDACAEFVRMQHDIARLLDVDADTDSIALHDRIYDELSRRAAGETEEISALPDNPEALKRIVGRHIRWRERAMVLLKEAAYLERKPADLARLIEFIDQSESRLVLAEKAPAMRSIDDICECGKRWGEHPAVPPWWPCMVRNAPNGNGDAP